MTSKIPQSLEALQSNFEEQIEFLKASAAAFDAGHEGEAKRLAVAIRVLIHDTDKSRSLMKQLGIKNRDYVDTSLEFAPANLLSHGGLVFVALGPPGNTRFVAMLDDSPACKTVPFDTWWNEKVFVDKDRRILTRKDLVLIAANQDGGAHVDPALDARYAELDKGLGWIATENGATRVMGPVTAKLCVLATGPRCLIPAFGRLAGCRFGRGWGPLLTFRRFGLLRSIGGGTQFREPERCSVNRRTPR